MDCKKKYTVINQVFNTAKDVTIDENANGWTAVNLGDVTVYVNEVPLLPRPAPGLSGESYEVAGNIDEHWSGRIRVSFAPGANPLVLIASKIYV